MAPVSYKCKFLVLFINEYRSDVWNMPGNTIVPYIHPLHQRMRLPWTGQPPGIQYVC